MTVKDLIDKLLQVPDKSLPVRIQLENDYENLWVTDVDFSVTGEDGYPIEGEVRLTISE